MEIEDFIVLDSSSIASLEEQMIDFSKKGFVPQGGITYGYIMGNKDRGTWAILMVKEKQRFYDLKDKD